MTWWWKRPKQAYPDLLARADGAWQCRYGDLQNRHLALLNQHADMGKRYAALQDKYIAVASIPETEEDTPDRENNQAGT
jgi:hypothetical protein